ncbi:hypothetical protein ACN261_11230 [Micromonospora sp. WMMD723]|uniref:hypothetical protein n=1 Tax=Micromonospora sp. WMMD723 TaxID=3403465 RepID=UPI003CF8E0BB
MTVTRRGRDFEGPNSGDDEGHGRVDPAYAPEPDHAPIVAGFATTTGAAIR